MKKLVLTLILLITFVCHAEVTITDIGLDTVHPEDSLVALLRSKFAQVNTDVDAVSGLSNRGTGDWYYVDSAVGNDNYTGTKPEWATATIDAAVALCTANNGDVICVMQGHAKNIATAAALNLDVAGITVYCLGNGDDRPELSLTAAASTIQIAAADVWIYNLRILGNYTNGVTEAVDITADGDGYGIIGCEFRETTNAKELLIMITVTADADRGVIAGNRFLGESGGTDSVAVTLEGGSDKSIIRNNTFIGDWSGYVIDGTTAASTEILVHDNYIHNADAGAGKTIAFHSSTTGGMFMNRCYGNGSSFELVGDAMFISPDNIVMQTENVEGRNYESMLGAFTGPAAGTAQEDNVKASLDLLNTDTAAIITGTSNAGQALPSAKSLFDIIGETYTDDAGGDHLDDVYSHINLLMTYTGDGDGAGGAGATLPSGKSLFDIIGETYTDDAGADHLDDVYAHLNLIMKYTADGSGGGAAVGAGLPTGKSLFDIIGDEYTDDAGGDHLDSVAAHINLLSKYIADGDGDWATGTAMASDKSIADALGTNGTTLVDGTTSVVGIIGLPADASHLCDSSTVTADADGSVFERLEYVQSQAARILVDTTGNFSANDYQTADSPVTIFTVTGDVMVQCFAVVDTGCTSTGTSGTLELGTTDSTASLLVQDIVDGAAFQAGDVWTSGAGADNDIGALGTDWNIIGGSQNIILTIATNDMTAGIIDFYVQWIPLSSDGAIVGAAP